MDNNLPHLCFIGPMTGEYKGGLPTQGEFLASLFSQDGYPVKIVSSSPNRYFRLLDILWTVFTNRKDDDVFIIQTFSGRGFILTEIPSLLIRKLGKRIILFLRGGNLPEFSRTHSDRVKRVLKRADIIITPSSYLADELAWLGFPIRIIPNVIDLPSYPFKQRYSAQPRLLWMRSFHSIYNPEMAIRTLASLSRTVPSATLTMAGPDKGLLTQVRALASELGIQEKVNFPGFLNHEAIVQVGTTHDIYLNTNHIDNMPISILEIAAMGLPIISTSVGGIPNLLTHEVNALLVKDGDYQEMSDAVLRLLNEPNLAGSLSANGRKFAELSQWQNVKRQWIQVIQP